jgi:hypothetical protein
MRGLLLRHKGYGGNTRSRPNWSGERKSSDIEIISVVPRSPEVKPFAMSVPAAGRQKTASLVNPTDDPSLDRTEGKLASADSPKPVPTARDDKQ